MSTRRPKVIDMSVNRWKIGEVKKRKAPSPNGPEIEIVIGADDGQAMALLAVTVPAGAAMADHSHGASEAMLIPQSGHLRLVNSDDDTAVELEPGVLATIPVDQRVRLENPTDEAAEALVMLTPPDFAAQLADWPTA